MGNGSHIKLSRAMRLQRDEMALKDISKGMRVGDVAEKYGLSRMGLWKRRQAIGAETKLNRGTS